jgi:gamma-glutamyltranspeptidase/glutathione hydrolase
VADLFEQIMKMIEPFNLAEMGHNSLKAIQVITEAEESIC